MGSILDYNAVLKIRLLVYMLLIALGFVVFVAAAVMKDETHVGICPLYGDKLTAGPQTNCNYAIAVAILFQALYLLFRVSTSALLYAGKIDGNGLLFCECMELIYTIIDFLAFFFIFIASCILSVGTNVTCENFNCEGVSWATASAAAQIAAWFSTLLWLFVFAIAFYALYDGGKVPCFKGYKKPKAQNSSGDPAVYPSITSDSSSKPVAV